MCRPFLHGRWTRGSKHLILALAPSPMAAQPADAQPAPAAPAAADVQPAPAPAPAPGDLMVLPSRVLLEGRAHATEVMLRNQGSVAGTYRIFVKEMRMTPNGDLQDRDKAAGEITAADLIRFSPHQVLLGPGETQTIRIQTRIPEGLPDGEYRSHLVFEGVPTAEIPQPPGADAPHTLSVILRPIFGISIPLILRHGETQGRINLADLGFQAPATAGEPPELDLNLVRTGNLSLLGDLEASVASGTTQKAGTVVGRMRGVAVYDSIPARAVKLYLTGTAADYRGGRLKVTYTPKDFKAEVETAWLDIP